MISKSDFIQLSSSVSYLPAMEEPFTSDCVFIRTDSCTWIFDAGSADCQAQKINDTEGIKNIVISHFHGDHIGNLNKLTYDSLFVSSYTKRYTKEGTVVTGERIFNDTCGGKPVRIKITEIPSSHAKGCLCLVFEDYAFLGDATYCTFKGNSGFYNSQLLLQEIEFLERLDAAYLCLSHSRKFVHDKNDIIQLLKGIYKKRDNKSPLIYV